MTQKSTAYCPAVIVAAFNELTGDITCSNEFQEWFFGCFGDMNLSTLNDNLWAMAGAAAEINAFFEEKGFPEIKVDLPGVAAVFKLAVEWANQGQKSFMFLDEGTFQGAEFDVDDEKIQLLSVEGQEYPVLKLATKDEGWNVYIQEIPDFDGESSELPDIGQQIVASSKGAVPHRAGAVMVPASSIDTDVDVDDFVGLEKDWLTVGAAVKKVRFEFDHKGAKAEAAFAAVLESAMGPQPYQVTKSYVAVFQHDDMAEAAFTAFVTPESWTRM